MAWREHLTGRMLRAYFANRAFYALTMRRGDAQPIDNPDQRIADDIRAFTKASAVLVVGLMRKLFSMLAFAGEVVGGGAQRGGAEGDAQPIDRPDQRIVDDIRACTEASAILRVERVRKLLHAGVCG